MMIWQINKNYQIKSLKTQVAPGVFLLFIFLFLSAISFPVLSQCTGSCTTTTVSGDTVHRFTGAGTFTPPEGIASVQYLVVGGGGGGGGTIGSANVGGAGGGGAGGVRSGTLTVTPLLSYTITVGAGGTAGVGNTSAGGTGGASIFSTITANGGGGGASVGFAATTGGSGGGGRLDDNGATGTAGQGNSGGTGAGTTTASGGAAGGGGAGAVGGNGAANTGGAGGAGSSNSITGTATFYGGGGGGGGFFNSSPGGAGGAGGNGGGAAAPGSRAAGNNGTANTGGGGSGAGGGANASSAFNGGTGGSGVVIIRYTPGGTRYAIANGNWNATSTWSSTSCSGSSGASVPTAADDVVICNNRTVTVNANAFARSVVLDTGPSNVNLNHSAGISLTVGSGGVTLNGGTSTSNPTKTWNIGSGSATVNGSVALNGGDSNNRPVRIDLSTGTLDVNGNLTFTASDPSRAIIQATGAANIYLSGSLNVSGSARMLPGTASTFTYDGTGTQTALLGVSEINYYNLVFAGSGTKNQTTNATPTIAGATTVNAGVTFNNSSSVTYQGVFINNGTTNATAANQYQSTVTNNNIFAAAAAHVYQADFVNTGTTTASAINQYQGNFINNGTYTASAAQQYRANFTNSGTFNAGTDAHTFNGTVAQQITGATTFGTMTLNNTAGLTINNDVTIQNILNLTAGILTTGTNVLRIAQAGGWSGVNRTNGWVAGNLGLWFPTGWQSRTFDIGDASAYRPVTLTIPNVTTAGYIVSAISQSSGDHPQIASSAINSALSVNRWWSITSGGAAMASMDVVFNYLAADIDAGATPSSFIIQRYSGSTWNDVTEGTLNATSSQGTGITGFGQFAIGQTSSVTPICDTLVSGIYGQYFNNMTLSGTTTATRLDGPIDFDWVGNAPGPSGIGANQFSVRWDGVLRVTETGNYRFQTASDDGVRLWVNDVQLINNWTDHGNTTDTSAQIALTAGQTYSIRLEFYENGGNALIRLRWQVPSSGTFVAIPAGPSPTLGAGLYHCAVTEICSSGTPSAGVQGEYFNNMTLTGTAVGTRVDGPIDFQWLQAAPGVAGVNANQFSVRWNGRLRVTVTGNYQFQTRSDDGVRLWVNGIQLINQWNDHSATDHTSGNIYLEAGQAYTILLEFYENNVDAEIRLRWMVPGTGTFVAIPAGVAPAATTAGLYYCSSGPSVSYYTISHSGSGITCEAEPITVTAYDSSGNVVAPAANTTAVLSSSPATGVWVGGDSFVFSGTETGFTKYLQQTTPGALTLSVTDGTATNLSPSSITFANAGLRFYGNAALGAMPNLVAGVTDSNPVLRAVQTNTDTMACETRVVGTRTVQLAYECINPTTCSSGQTFLVNGGAINPNDNGAVSSYANVSLTFNAAGTASIPLNFTDVGQVRLYANLALAASGNDPAVTLTGSSSPFVVKPYTLAVSAVTGNPGTTNAGAGFTASWNEFSVYVEARNANGNRTPNFGNEATTERNNVALNIAQLVYPSGGAQGSLTGAGAGSFTATTPAGTMLNNTVRWNEVGSIRLQPYFTDSDYLSAGDLVALTTSNTIGRFYPNHFTLSSSSVTNACPSVSGSAAFTYMGISAIATAFVLEARNANNQITTNYRSPAYSGTASLSYVAENANSGVDLASRVSVVSPSWALGVMTLPPLTTATFNRQASTVPDGPYTSLQLGVRLSGDIDNRTLENLDMNAATTGVCTPASCTAKAIGSALNVRYGRLRLDSAFGPESVNLPVNFSTEYWVGSFFVKNTDDNCTRILRSAITYPSGSILIPGNLTVPLSGGSTVGVYPSIYSDATQVGFTSGDALHYFQAPGTGTGLFNVSVDLTSFPWLRSDGNINGNHNDDTTITARYGFGQYRGHDRIIYWREKFE